MLPRLRSLGVDVEGVADLFIENVIKYLIMYILATCVRMFLAFPQAEKLTELYVPFCRDKSGADDLLTSHRSYFDVSSLSFVWTW